MKDNLCVILDGMTRSSYTTREEFLADSRSAKADDEFAEKIKSLFKEVQIINSVGFSSGEKMYLADRVSFFITGFWTDSLWVAKFARAYGVAFGSKEGFRQCLICFQPNTIIMPSEYVVDIGHKGQNLSTVGYSINPDCFIGFVKNALSSFENIEKREIIFDGKGFVSNHNSQKRFYALKSLKQHKSSYLSVAENFAPFSVNTSKSYKIESGMEYNFAVNGFSKNGSFVLIVGYDEYHKRVFVDKMNFLETKKCFFPKEVKSFRLFIKLMP
ncbi:hypothetical protein [Helicobacter sp. MIT 05-5294]|uniref:hypothetical protein n=1 Tax=Helicobacter sp. MIT 05-5294 TaxID=1548150 RepID=UPI00051FBD9C|nr:hypothetical protein [Helicobacter sp. MIT 05-5294]TLD89229.1 hypothetical protein LS69_000960 [Helicobacter sp. MIT 05-5294]